MSALSWLNPCAEAYLREPGSGMIASSSGHTVAATKRGPALREHTAFWRLPIVGIVRHLSTPLDYSTYPPGVWAIFYHGQVRAHAAEGTVCPEAVLQVLRIRTCAGSRVFSPFVRLSSAKKVGSRLWVLCSGYMWRCSLRHELHESWPKLFI